MKTDLSKVKVGDKIWTIQGGWEEVINIENGVVYSIKTINNCYTIDGLRWKRDDFPSAFTEYPFKEQSIEKDTLVWFRDSEHENWKIGYYSHFKDNTHFIFDYSQKSTHTTDFKEWNIVTTENPLL
jgi:hypothetical protein